MDPATVEWFFVDDEGNASDGTVTSYNLTQYLADREANYREDGETASPLMVCCDGTEDWVPHTRVALFNGGDASTALLWWYQDDEGSMLSSPGLGASLGDAECVHDLQLHSQSPASSPAPSKGPPSYQLPSAAASSAAAAAPAAATKRASRSSAAAGAPAGLRPGHG